MLLEGKYIPPECVVFKCPNEMCDWKGHIRDGDIEIYNRDSYSALFVLKCHYCGATVFMETIYGKDIEAKFETDALALALGRQFTGHLERSDEARCEFIYLIDSGFPY